MSEHDTAPTPAAPALAGPAPISVWNCLTYADAPKAIDFLVAIGFVSTLTVPGSDHVGPDGSTDPREVAHAELRWPEGGGVMLGSQDPTGNEFAQRPVGSASTYVVTDHVQAVHDRAVAAGAEIIMPITSPGYGGSTFSLRDFEGNLWSFGDYRGE